MAEILALGEPLIEFVRLPQPVEGRPVYRQSFGGDTSNAIVAAARQGARTGYISAVGEDILGQELLDLWAHEGVDCSMIKVLPQAPTGVYFVQPDPEGRKFSYARKGSAASCLGPGDLPEEAIARAKVLHVSAISQAVSPSMRQAVVEAARIAKENGTLVSYDTNLRLNLWSLEQARETIEAFLPFADIVFPSLDEAMVLTNSESEEAILDHYSRFGGITILKRGDRGPVLVHEGTKRDIAVPTVEAIDSTGAGDSFAGAFLAYFLETNDALYAGQSAALVAAKTVCGFGAIDPIPTRSQIFGVSC